MTLPKSYDFVSLPMLLLPSVAREIPQLMLVKCSMGHAPQLSETVLLSIVANILFSRGLASRGQPGKCPLVP